MRFSSEEPDCPFCISSDTEFKSEGEETSVYECQDCDRTFSGPNR
jgi:transposase-like protein